MPIYLYKKTHNITGLMYLGKTTQDPYLYKGSGKRWVPHIKKHGYIVTTEIIKECSSLEELKYWGEYYSEVWNIVNDRNWANLKPESGDGFGSGDNNPMSNPSVIQRHANKINSPDIKAKHRAAMIARHQSSPYDAQTKEKIRSKLSDPAIYTFYHKNGTIENCTRQTLIKRYSLPSGHVSNMIHEKHRIVKGWKVQ